MTPLKVGTAYVDIAARFDALKASAATKIPGMFKGAGEKAGTSFASAFQGKLKSGLSDLKGAGFGSGGLGSLVGAASIGAAIVGLKKIADETAAYAGEIRTLKAVTGASAEDSSRLVGVLHALGVETSTATRPIVTIASELEKGGGKLKNWFNATEIAKFRNQDLSKTLFDLGDKYKSLTNARQRDAFMVDVLTKRGLKLLPVLAGNRKEFEEIIKKEELRGNIFTDTDLKNARAYSIALRELNSTVEGLEHRFGKFIIPRFKEGVKDVDDLILGGEKAGGAIDKADAAVSRFTDRLFKLKKGSSENFWNKLDDNFAGIGSSTDNADAKAKAFEQTLEGIEEKAAHGDKDAAQQLQRAFESAFKLSDNAAANFQKRLESLTPTLGETFKDLKIGDVDRGTAAQAAASDKLKDANDRLADAEGRLTKAYKAKTYSAEDVAAAERDVAAARDEVTKANDEVAKSHGSLTDALKATLEKNTSLLGSFAGDLSNLNGRLAKIASKGGEDMEQAFLGHLQGLGPAAVPLLDQLVKLSDEQLAGMSDIFGGSIAAAKKAADFQFDKFPPNFREKIGAVRAAAAQEVGNLLGEFDALPDHVDTPEWRSSLDDMALEMEQLGKQGKLPLTQLQQGFLTSAENAQTAEQKARYLQQFVNAMTGKELPIDLNIKFTGGGGGKFSGHGASGTWDVTVDRPAPDHRASGGPASSYRDYVVGEDGPELLRMGARSGTVIPKDKLTAAGAPPTIFLELTNEVDGEVFQRKTVRFAARAAEDYRKARA